MRKTVARIGRVHGLLLHEGALYMVSDRALDVAQVQSNGSLSAPRRLLSHLPEGGNHPVQAQSPQGTTKKDFCLGTEAPGATTTAHSAPIGFVFCTGTQFPKEYQGDGFVAMRGSWNRSKPSGDRVLRVRFTGR